MRKHVKGLLNLLLNLIIIVSFIQVPKQVSAEAISTRSLAMINKPGVVLLQTVWTADITFYEFSFAPEFEEDLIYTISAMVEEGTIANDEYSMYSAMVQLMIENMYYYTFYTGNVYTEASSTAAIGTGFIVTPDGYLVTNAHVVHTNEEELNYNFAMTALADYAIEGANSFLAEMRTFGYEMSQEEYDGILYAFYNILSNSISINNLTTQYYCYMGNISPGSDVGAKGYALDLRKMGEPIPGKDIAILKLDKTNLPTVTLGDDQSLRTGDKVYAMGYPAMATINDALNVSQAIQEPTLTSGIISARKEMAGGWSILQTDATIHGGNSGGPLFNEKGEVIGVNTFGMLDPDSGAPLDGMNFAIPINIAIQYLNELNVTPAESQFSMKFKSALSLFEDGKYTDSLEILRGLNETNPGYPVVADLLSEARILADQQPSPTPTTEPTITDAVKAGNKDEDSLTMGSEKVSTKTSGKNVTAFSKSFIKDYGLVLIGGAIILILLVIIIILIVSRKKLRAVGQTQANTYSQSLEQIPYQGPQQISNSLSHQSPVQAINEALDSQPANQGSQESPGSQHSADSISPDAKYCTNCGRSLNAGAKFCSGCGARIE